MKFHSYSFDLLIVILSVFSDDGVRVKSWLALVMCRGGASVRHFAVRGFEKLRTGVGQNNDAGSDSVIQ